MSDAGNEIKAFKTWWSALAAEQAKAPPSLTEQRSTFDIIHGAVPLPEGCEVTPLVSDSVRGELIVPKHADRTKALLYHHGGGFTFGSALSHRHMVARIAEAAGVVAFNMDYRLAPEHAFPAALDDAMEDYRYVLSQGFAASRIVVAGESAGGNLTASLLLALRDNELELPAAAYLLSPWLDLAQQGDSYEVRREYDPMITREALDFCATAYCGELSVKNPYISPLKADLYGLPPIFIQVGTDEVLLSDSLEFTRSAALAGLDVRLHVWPDMVHAWLLFHSALPTAGLQAIKEAGEWIASQLGAPAKP
uniref:Omega-pentadecalactone hydrolase n=1 Tax=Pseudomonas sp. HI-70 TaxID=341693 RepID=T2HUU7_9PSED|nr:omega-pentadecalactone hydrolase [Pseudomonas sp. HI-70]